MIDGYTTQNVITLVELQTSLGILCTVITSYAQHEANSEAQCRSIVHHIFKLLFASPTYQIRCIASITIRNWEQKYGY